MAVKHFNPDVQVTLKKIPFLTHRTQQLHHYKDELVISCLRESLLYIMLADNTKHRHTAGKMLGFKARSRR